ncbi:MAG: hypothetical protein ABIH66_06715 [bacterium]
MKTKNAALITFVAFGALCLSVIFSGAASGAEKRTPVETLDEVFFDGNKLVFAYTIESKCEESKHSAEVELYVDKTSSQNNKKVIALYIDITDVSPEDACVGEAAGVTVAAEKGVGRLIREELSALEKDGYAIPPDVAVELLPVRAKTAGASTLGGVSAPVVLPGKAVEGAREPAPAPPPTPQATPEPPKVVDVVEVDYAPAWRCQLRKNDGSRKDGFDGYGSTVEEARNDAASGCLSTNHPKCFDFSKDPAHTQCDFELRETQKVVQYSSDKLPANAETISWTCELWKSDGSRKDGFSGTAATEAEARSQAARGCGRTNHPLCEQFSLDAAHTSCARALMVRKPKPETLWTCALWKKDGSRKDGFGGTGPTEAEARRDTLPGCYRTNHPKCNEWSLDPAHTACEVKLVYPEGK